MHIEGSPREMDSGHNKSTEEGAEQFTPRQVYEDIVNGTDIAADERGRKLREKIRGGGSEATELKRAIITGLKERWDRELVMSDVQAQVEASAAMEFDLTKADVAEFWENQSEK